MPSPTRGTPHPRPQQRAGGRTGDVAERQHMIPTGLLHEGPMSGKGGGCEIQACGGGRADGHTSTRAQLLESVKYAKSFARVPLQESGSADIESSGSISMPGGVPCRTQSDACACTHRHRRSGLWPLAPQVGVCDHTIRRHIVLWLAHPRRHVHRAKHGGRGAREPLANFAISCLRWRSFCCKLVFFVCGLGRASWACDVRSDTVSREKAPETSVASIHSCRCEGGGGRLTVTVTTPATVTTTVTVTTPTTSDRRCWGASIDDFTGQSGRPRMCDRRFSGAAAGQSSPRDGPVQSPSSGTVAVTPALTTVTHRMPVMDP